MYASAILFAAAASLVAAQTSSSSGPVSGCGSQIDIIIQTCVATEKAQLDNCKPNDWDCLCEQSNNVLTCYNNCPSDPNRFGVEQTKVSYCNAAKAYPTHATTTILSSTTTSSNTASRTSTSSTNAINAVSPSPSSPTHTGAATVLLAPAGAVVAIFGALALF